MSDERTSGPDYYDDDAGDEIDDDFLYHLYQGGDLLQNNRVVEAKDHLEKAFSLKPGNPRGQNLLGLVYFKLGLYQRAIDIYRDLVIRFPNDPTLRVNLAMVHFKAEQLDQAEDELRQALQHDPEHRNANRYLGLVLARKGDSTAARSHFERADVKNVDKLLGECAEGDEDLTEQCREEIETDQIAAIAAVADEGFRELEENEFPFEAAGSGTTLPPAREDQGEEEDEPGDEESIFSQPPANLAQTDAAPSAAEAGFSEPVAESWHTREKAVMAPDPDPERAPDPPPAIGGVAGFALEDGAMSVDVAGEVYCRLGTMRWAEGDFVYRTVFKRFAGEDTRHSFDRDDQMMVRVEGHGSLRLAWPQESELTLFEHQHGSAYFVEDAVFAFFGTREWENGRLPSSGEEDLPIFHLFSPGPLVLVCPGNLVRKQLASGDCVRVRASRLIGWSGNLLPRLFVGEPPLPRLLWIDLSGEGEVLCVD